MDTRDLIDFHNNNFSAYYNGQLYSHTPMALIALKNLGATEQRISDHFEHDIIKLMPRTPCAKLIDENNWQDFLGNIQYESSYVNYFKTDLQHNGTKKTLNKYFDRLIKGVAAAAFHPLIRLFFGLKSNNTDEVAYSLATWAASYIEMNTEKKINNNKTIIEILKHLQTNNFNQNKIIVGKNIANRMLSVSLEQQYTEAMQAVKISELTQHNLEESLLWIFSQSNNFTILHGITSHQAFEYLVPFSLDEGQARIYFWKAILAAYLSTTGSMSIDFNWSYPKIALPLWPEIKAQAILSNDNHVIKLIYTLATYARPDLDYQRRYAAALKLQLI